MFRRYHYLSGLLHKAAEVWVGTIGGKEVAMVAVLQFPMRKGWKRISRLVVLPDYQGVGVGSAMLNAVANKYYEGGWQININTSSPAIVFALKKSSVWALGRYGRVPSIGFKQKAGLDNTLSRKRKTFSFNYKITGPAQGNKEIIK